MGDNDRVKILHREPHPETVVAVLEHFGADSATFAAVGSAQVLLGSLMAKVKAAGYCKNQAHKDWCVGVIKA